jgi:hypothetical protein
MTDLESRCYSPANDYTAPGERDKSDFEFLWRGFTRVGGNSEIIAICQNNGMLESAPTSRYGSRPQRSRSSMASVRLHRVQASSGDVTMGFLEGTSPP